jgi:hypothetical protein
VTLMAVLAFTFALIAAISPAALAGRSEVYFSDVDGNPKTEWKVGEVLYITVVSHDENRDSDETEVIDERSRCRTHSGVDVPCVEVWDPNTKDSETNQGSLAQRLVLVETGINTGIFRSQTGILIRSFDFDSDRRTPPRQCEVAGNPCQENGSLEVFHGDTILVRYQSPSDNNDIDLDIARIVSTPGQIRITNKAGQEQPVWQVGQQIWVTVEDPDQNIDPLRPDTIRNVTLWTPRCVWDVLERAGAPRDDQPQPKPCQQDVGPFGYDSRLNASFPQYFNDSLTLVETGPNTGVFRNVQGITLVDNLGPIRTFPVQPESSALFVNHKDTIVAFYRKPTLVGEAVVTPPPPPPPPPPPATRTDTCPASPIFTCSRTVPIQVAPGQTFDVKLSITARQDMRLIALREQAPAGFSFTGTPQGSPPPQSIGMDGALRAAWDGGITTGQTFTLTYQFRAGATPGTFKIRGFFTGAPFTIVPLVSDVIVMGGAQSLSSTQVSAQVAHVGENAQLRISRERDNFTANVGETVTLRLTVTAKQALPAVSIREDFDGLTLADQGADFIGVDPPSTLRGLMIQPAAGTTTTYTYQVRCAAQGTFTLRGVAESRNVTPVTAISTVTCGPGGPPPPPPPPPAAVGYDRGEAAPEDPQDFALAQAKVGHMNPAKIVFSDINGREVTEFRIGMEFFITLIDDDQNIDSDHAETLCVQVFNVNGGREGDTPGVARSLNNLLKDDPRACLEDHVRDLFMWKTGVRLVETGLNTGEFRNPNALRIVGICEQPEAEMYGFNTDPADTPNVQIHKLNWWQEPSVKIGTVLKDCHPSTPGVREGRSEYSSDGPTVVPVAEPGVTAVNGDVPGVIAVHSGDVVYVTFQDQLVDPFDVVYATARVRDFRSINQIQFVTHTGSPADTYKIGQDVFILLRDEDRNVNSNVVDKVEILVLNRNSGDWENVLLEETGPDTGEFMNRAGLSLQPALRPDTVRVNNNRLEMFDRDVIEAHYQDNYNPKDYSAAWIRLIPQPQPGPGVPVADQSQTQFSDAQGRPVSDYAVGDTVYVMVRDASRNVSTTVVDVIQGAIMITNVRTGQQYGPVDATETGANTGVFVSEAITTGAPGSLVDLEVAEGDTLKAEYVDPQNPSDKSEATVRIITRVFSCTGARFTSNMTFMAVGSGIAQIAVRVYDLSGRMVATLGPVSGAQTLWDGRAAGGETLARGVYLYQLTCSGRAGEQTTVAVQKLMLR